MPDFDDVTQWIGRLTDGDEAAAQVIWEQYFDKLVRLARKKLDKSPRRVADEEDVALSAMHSFYRRAVEGRFPQLNDRHDLWKLLVTITARKAFAQMKRLRAQKRGGGDVRGESIFVRSDELKRQQSMEGGGIAQILGEEPTPEFACQVAETCSRLLDQLDDEDLKRIATYKIEGYSNEEIAEQMDCVVRTVERKLARIREAWGYEREESQEG
ncbi:MAG: ECF-type sigma factor [Planctomycetota bacterium]|jgi:DNA-directed RNA polymerase specialized sigma24 family protein